MTYRPMCACGQRPVAINYIKEDVTHYRKVCDTCARKSRKLKPTPPAWARSGYKKKPHCEKCGFKAKLPEQLNVFHVDGNLKNTNWTNLKTICANCTIEVSKSKLPWKPSPVVPDF